MRVDVLNIEGKPTGRSIELPQEFFGIEPNKHAVYLAIKQYNAAQRQGTHKTKEKWEVSRTTKKFKKQKGTGGARAGSLKSPTVKGGGRAFGPRPRKYNIDLNKKVKRLAKYSALSAKAASGNIKVLEDFTMDAPKTKKFATILSSIGLADKKSLILLPEYNNTLYLSGRNIPKANVVNVSDVNTYELLNAKEIVFLESAVAKFK